MEGFKNTTKMKYFKEGGFVTKKAFTKYEKKEDKSEVKADMAKDTKMVKSGVRQHESALHKGEPKTELKLKQGGRSKKDCGTVKKYKAGGEVTNVYEAKKKSGDKDNIAKVKQITPTKATAASAAKGVKNTTAKFCGGKSVQKYNEGKMVKQAGATEAQQKYYQKNMDKGDKKANAALYEAVGSRGDAARKGMEEGRMDALGTAYKKGGKAKKLKKYADGGTVMSDEEKNWLGGADATDPIILARMRSALGTKKPVAAPVKPETSADLDPYGVTRRETSADLDPYGAASKPVAAPVRRAPARPAPVKPETSADLDPYGVTRRETSADLDPYGAASSPAATAKPASNMYANRQPSIMQRFFNSTPADQAAQFNQSAQARKNVKFNLGMPSLSMEEKLAALSKK